MRPDRAILGVHAFAVLLALGAALVWPREGQAAVMIPLGRSDLGTVLQWVEAEDSRILARDPGSGRVIVGISNDASLWRALAVGIVPVAARNPGCTPPSDKRRKSWKN
jgi:hypothetical protein